MSRGVGTPRGVRRVVARPDPRWAPLPVTAERTAARRVSDRPHALVPRLLPGTERRRTPWLRARPGDRQAGGRAARRRRHRRARRCRRAGRDAALPLSRAPGCLKVPPSHPRQSDPPMTKPRHRKLIVALAAALLVAPAVGAASAAAARADSPPPSVAFASVVPEAARVRRGVRFAPARTIRWGRSSRRRERRRSRRPRLLAAALRQVWPTVHARGPPQPRMP